MGISPGSLAWNVPPQMGDDARKQRDLERTQREQASALSAAATQIGSGGLLVNGGGSITISGTGSLNVGSGALNSGGSITAATTITAGGNIQGGGLISTGGITATGGIAAGGNVSGANVSATGNVSAGGGGTFPTGVNSTGVYNNLLTVAYRVQYVDSTGAMGYVPSSRRFKQDITPAPDVTSAMMAMQVVTFRYNQAVAELGAKAAVEWGVIAEDMDALGLKWAVDYDAQGLPYGVKYDRIVLALIPTLQDHERRLTAAGL
ncbi:hypothetical protein G3T36_17335 [Diaminobutyricibacter tongyongensis]|uniref:Peptidase S74 domain-containing protein n=1 Tax=Leifsonia tongyongensis TaxID=1268043 RepID=A0A6L9Y1U7_9MICO|nr:tail fiber domain-containing protein [Diaminobutyricibacter tongyongensis]NEN07623.1 hypothetical protein [Diaminobutyricibacter tongyongensis]